MSDQDYATVSGTKVHKSDFAYAPAGSEPSEWKLPIHDASHVRNALARFNQTQLPAGAKAAALAKIHAAAKRFGIDAGKTEASDLRLETGDPQASSPKPQASIAVLLVDAGAAVDTPAGMAMQRPGAQLREIAVAVPGTWVKGDHKFSISKEDLVDMAANFEKRKNDMIVIDYEHASEMPEIAKGGPVPGAGWIHGLRLGDGAQQAAPLLALVEWTPQAEEMLRTGQYRFFSPAIDWGAKDKETGESQGATLTSGALTNHPFLEELPPIMMSDGTLISQKPETRHQKGATTMVEKDVGAPSAASTACPAPKTANLAEKEGKGDHDLPMLKIRKGRKGSKHEGHHILSDGDSDRGCMSDEDLGAYAAKHLGVNPDDAADEKEKAREAERHALLLTEVAKGGKIDSRKAIELADQGKITFADYIRAQEAEKVIDAAVQQGKILPRDRKFFFRDALERPVEFAEYVKNAPQAVRLGSIGLGESEAVSPDQEVAIETKKLMSENGGKLKYADALRQVMTANPQLADRYRAAHSGRVNADGTAN